MTHTTDLEKDRRDGVDAATARSRGLRFLSCCASNIDEEAALYDRQIRVWGVQAQNMLRNSRVLIVGVTAMHCEVAKNLALAGVGSLSILDNSTLISEEDINSHFLLYSADVGLNKAKAVSPRIAELNPNVKIEALDIDASSQPLDFWKSFNVISLSGCDLRFALSLEQQLSTLKKSPGLFFCDAMNFDAFFCQNLFTHNFVETVPGENGAADTHTEETIIFPTLAALFSASIDEVFKSFGRRCRKEASIFAAARLVYSFQDQFGRWPDETDIAKLAEFQKDYSENNLMSNETICNIVKNWRLESAPSAAVLGGIQSQEILKTVTHKDKPLLNITVFSGWGGSAVNVQIPAKIPSQK